MAGVESRWVLFWFLLALIAIQGLAGVLLVNGQERLLREQAAAHSEHELDLVEDLIREPLLKHDYVTVVQFFRQWGQRNPKVAYVKAVAGNGFVLAEYGTPQGNARAPAPRRIDVGAGQAPVTVHIEHSLADIQDETATLRRQLLLGGVLVTSGLGWTLWWILARLGLRPLRVEIGRRIAVENELRIHRNLLDEEVRERTRDLERTVMALRASETALTEKSADLEATNVELQQLIYVISHDLKGPLRAVSHLSTALEDECSCELSPAALGLLATLRSRVQRMHALIEGLLAHSRAGRAAPEERVDCNRMVAEIIESLAAPPGFVFSVGPLPDLHTGVLHLRQVLANLIENAIVHHDRGEGLITVCADYRGGDEYEFAVSDDGPGIASEYRDQVFELFRTLQSRDRKEHTGMGLALVKKIVEGRGGKVAVDACDPRGVTIRFTWRESAAPAPLAKQVAETVE